VAYDIAHNLPKWYPLFGEGVTPRTLVLPGTTFDLDEVAKRVWQTFQALDPSHEPADHMELPGPQPVMVKDYLKSAKHRWHDACYISDCQDFEDAKRVTKNFLDTQGDSLTGGLCFRKFIRCRQIGTHSKTRAPLFNEWRAFLKHGRVIYLAPYWAEGDYTYGLKADTAIFETLCAGLKDLPFVAVDIGQRDGVFPREETWVVFEVNDGGSAGVPEGGDVNEFYRVLHKEFAE
jgi:hypothetical protein